jgi:hypothetical protein
MEHANRSENISMNEANRSENRSMKDRNRTGERSMEDANRIEKLSSKDDGRALKIERLTPQIEWGGRRKSGFQEPARNSILGLADQKTLSTMGILFHRAAQSPKKLSASLRLRTWTIGDEVGLPEPGSLFRLQFAELMDRSLMSAIPEPTGV